MNTAENRIMELREKLRACEARAQTATERAEKAERVRAAYNDRPPYSPAVLKNIAGECDFWSENRKAAEFEQWYQNERTNRVNLQNIMRRASAGEDADPTLVYPYEADNLFRYTAKLRAEINALRFQRTQHEAKIENVKAQVTTLQNLLADARGLLTKPPTVASDMQNIATPPAPWPPRD